MMGGGFHVGKALGANTPAQAGWFAASYPSVVPNIFFRHNFNCDV